MVEINYIEAIIIGILSLFAFACCVIQVDRDKATKKEKIDQSRRTLNALQHEIQILTYKLHQIGCFITTRDQARTNLNGYIVLCPLVDGYVVGVRFDALTVLSSQLPDSTYKKIVKRYQNVHASLVKVKQIVDNSHKELV